jgi:hypothetical protein
MRVYSGSNRGPSGLQPDALPLSYRPLLVGLEAMTGFIWRMTCMIVVLMCSPYKNREAWRSLGSV